jgi:quercetin dioxygenase-like cupin family protein
VLLVTVHARRVGRSIRAVAAVALLGAGCGDATNAVTDAQPAAATREVLGEASPVNAPGQTLYLQEVTIPPRTQLATHAHEGTQLARVRSGVLTLNIVSGTVVVTRAGGAVEEVTGPAAVQVRPGDSVTENPDLVHYGANDGAEPVVILLAALLRDGAPLATPRP